MIHLFTIHSHITFLAALGAIVFEKIPTEDVVLICGSGYKPQLNENFKGIIIKSHDELISDYTIIKRMHYFNYTKSANRYIENIIGTNRYIAYIDLMSVFNRYLVMHPQCQQFNIIEEGIVNYSDYDDFNLLTADLRNFDWQWTGLKNCKELLNAGVRLLRGRSLRMLALPIHPNIYANFKNVKAYCFSEYAFQNISAERKKIIPFNCTIELLDTNSIGYTNESWFWIGDTLSKAYKIDMDHFKDAIYNLMERINPLKMNKIIYLKFRGPESQLEKEITENALSDFNFSIEYMNSSDIMELIFLSGSRFHVCGIASSLLIYAKLMGHSTYSMYPFIPKTYNISLDNNYGTISKMVGYI